MLKEININPFTRKTKKGVKSVRGYKRKIDKKDNKKKPISGGKLAAGLGATTAGTAAYLGVEGIPRLLGVDQAKAEIPGLGYDTRKSRAVVRGVQGAGILGASLLGAGLSYGGYKATKKLLEARNKSKDKDSKRDKLLAIAAGLAMPTAVIAGASYLRYKGRGLNPAVRRKALREVMEKEKKVASSIKNATPEQIKLYQKTQEEWLDKFPNLDPKEKAIRIKNIRSASNARREERLFNIRQMEKENQLKAMQLSDEGKMSWEQAREEYPLYSGDLRSSLERVALPYKRSDKYFVDKERKRRKAIAEKLIVKLGGRKSTKKKQ